MTTSAQPSSQPEGPSGRRSPGGISVAAGASAAAATAVVLWGGYTRRWGWTGINGKTATLWDWLNLLLLPVAVGILPIWFSRRYRLAPRHKLWGSIAMAVFLVLVIAGYAIPWAWTGFSGNKLWDWLELLALPLAVALIPTVGELRRGWGPRHSVMASTGLAVFVVVVLGGYLAKWTWTGFQGNTLWDWLHLLLLPLLLPLVIVPALRPMATAGLIDVEKPRPDSTPIETDPEPSTAALATEDDSAPPQSPTP
jgi:hypothetical protein